MSVSVFASVSVWYDAGDGDARADVLGAWAHTAMHTRWHTTRATWRARARAGDSSAS